MLKLSVIPSARRLAPHRPLLIAATFFVVASPLAQADIREFEIKRKIVVEHSNGEVAHRIDGKVVAVRPPREGVSPLNSIEARSKSSGELGSRPRTTSGLVVPPAELDQVLNDIQDQYAESGSTAPAAPTLSIANNSFVKPDAFRRAEIPEDEEPIIDDE